MKIHIAKDGDTLQSLSEKYNVELDKIVAVNPQLANQNRVEPGKKVKIPAGPVAPQSVQAAAQKPALEAVKKPSTDIEAETFSPLAKMPMAAPAPVQAAENVQKPVAAESAQKPVQAAAENVQKPVTAAAENMLKPTVGGVSNAPKPVQPASEYLPMPFAIEMPNVMPFMQGSAAEQQQPAAYKTTESAYSPLNVKLKGDLNDAVHPFAPLPTPTVEAGEYANPFGMPPVPGFGGAAMGNPFGHQPEYPMFDQPPYGAMPLPSYGAMPMFGPMPGIPYAVDYPGIAPFGGVPAGVPSGTGAPAGVPAGFPQMHYPVAAHDCGCGKGAKPPLPYALPRSVNSAEEETRAAQDKATTAALPVETANGETAVQQEKQSATQVRSKNEKKAKVSSRVEALRKLIKRSKPKRQATRRPNKPWIID